MHDALASHAARLSRTPIAALFDAPGRAGLLTRAAAGLTLDLTRQRVDEPALDALVAFAAARGLEAERARLFAGEAVNASENRPALHMALRDTGRAWRALGAPAEGLAREEARAAAFAAAVRSGAATAADGRPYRAVLHLGVGGSDLGPRLVFQALRRGDEEITLRFAANIDPADLAAALCGLDPARTLVAFVSKSFTTAETRRNYEALAAWFAPLGPDALRRQTVVATARPDLAGAQGFAADRTFAFPAWVGGRYSLWASVGLSLQIALGPEVFSALKAGARAMDAHVEAAPARENLATLGALAGYWNRAVLGAASRVTIPYATRLALLPAYLQQLEMESNGKGAGPDGAPRAVSAGVSWGAEGANAQHAFFQQLHQGPDVIPAEFVLAAASVDGGAARHRELLANALAQAEALLLGRPAAYFEAAGDPPALAAQRACPGDRPSSVIVLPRVDAASLGALLAFYEHRTFAEGVLYGVNSFDQWGVELGKALAGDILAALESGETAGRHPSTAALIARLRGAR